MVSLYYTPSNPTINATTDTDIDTAPVNIIVEMMEIEYQEHISIIQADSFSINACKKVKESLGRALGLD